MKSYTQLKIFLQAVLGLACFTIVSNSSAQTNLMVHPGQHTAQVSPTMWGIFFEDINFSADGGLYAELVKNRSFEFPNPLMGWKYKAKNGADASLLVVNRGEGSNQRFVTISSKKDTGDFVLSNEGFRGIGLKEGEIYNFSAMVRKGSGNLKIKVEAVSESGEVLGETSLAIAENAGWQTCHAQFKSNKTYPNAQLNVVFEGKGDVDVDMISLFPADTWKHRPNGLRADLVQKLADLHPGFMRFPGGCIVEGRDLANRYQWKKTIGNPADRQLIMNRWNVEFSYRSTPDYYQSFGLGFFEYFQLCEDIRASPLPILNCGMACEYNSAEVVSMNEIDPYIQDALDLIEFANGNTDTKWGKLRIALGHPAPFNLKMIGVGNEQWGEQYIPRYKAFVAAIKAKYPDIKLIASGGPDPDGERFEYLTKVMHHEKADLIDEHYYRSPDWFLSNAKRYDHYDHKSSHVFAGEYAAHTPDNLIKSSAVESHNNWGAALAEAAFMTGLERNADVVKMASYAPLFADVNAWQWRPDLIWFDNLNSVATPNYYVQQVFATHRGDYVVPILSDGKPLTGQDSLYSSATVDTVNNELIIKIVNASIGGKQVNLQIDGKRKWAKQAEWLQVSSADKMAFNSLTDPDVVKPTLNNTLKIGGKTTRLTLRGLSVNVIVIKAESQ